MDGQFPWYLHPQWQTVGTLGHGTLMAIGMVMSMVGVVGTIGNLTVILLLLRYKKLQTSANMYVFNLALADLLMCVGNFPVMVVSSFSGKWLTGFWGCQIYSFVGGISGFVSINTLTAMACDRYNAIYRHKGLQRSRASRRHSTGFLVSLWIYSTLWAMPPFFGWGRFALDGGQISCCFDYLDRSANNVAYVVAIFVFCFGIQVLVILFCYSSIVRVVCRHERSLRQANIKILLNDNHYHHHSFNHHHRQDFNRTPSPTPTNHDDQSGTFKPVRSRSRKLKRKKRRVEVMVTRLVVVITVSFFIAWMPFAVVALIGVFGDASLITPLVSVLPGMLAKISTVINPLVYALGHPQYRSPFVSGCRGKRGRRRSEDRRGSEAAPTTRNILSSMYFATMRRSTENVLPSFSQLEMNSQQHKTSRSFSIV